MTAAVDDLGVVPLPSGVWSVDPERSEVGFTATSMWGMSTVRGTFGGCQGSLIVRSRALTGELAIDVRSLDTGNARRDRHLRSPDFFDAEHHPWIVFRVAAVTARQSDATITGELSVSDTDTQLEIPIDVEHIPDDGLRLHATTTISRAATGIAWNWLGMIGDDTSLHAAVTLTRTPMSASRCSGGCEA